MRLMATPDDPIGYYDAKERAHALVHDNKAAEAEPLAERITREYPRDGENWLLLGAVKRTLGKHAESAVAHERAGELLHWGSEEDTAAVAAIGYLHAGNRRASLDLLRHHISNGGEMDRTWLYDHKELAPLRTDPEFLEIAGRPDTTGWTRDYGWRRDLDFLRSEVIRLNADYRNNPLPAEFERRHENLKERIPRLSDEEIYVGMNRILAVLRQGHTVVYAPNDSRIPFRGLPFQMYAFPEGIFVIHAAETHRALVGSRVVSIEGVPVEEVLRRINDTQSVDGDNEHLFQGVNLLHSVAYLKGLGIATSSSVRVTLQKPSEAAQTIMVQASLFRETATLVPLEGRETPLFLRERKQVHWHHPLPEHDAIYVQLNAIANEPEESLAQFALRLRSILAESEPNHLILDMRLNPGGSTNSPGYIEFLRTMIGFSLLPDTRLYVLIGRRTYSAAGNLITELEQLADATFVGEASSECCTFYGSPSGVLLPYSRLKGTISTKRWSLSRKGNDFRREMSPDVPVITTAAQHFSGQDAVLATVIRLIERERPADPTGLPTGATAPN